MKQSLVKKVAGKVASEMLRGQAKAEQSKKDKIIKPQEARGEARHKGARATLESKSEQRVLQIP